MKLTCGSCQHQLDINDARLPAGAYFKVKCPKCSESITGKGPQKETASAAAAVDPQTPPPAPAPAAKFNSIPGSAEWERVKPFVEEYVNQRISALKKELESLYPQSPNGDSATRESFQSADGNKRALICEGNPKIEQAVSTSLSRMGYALDKVKSAKDALKKMEGTMYELIATGPAFVDDPSGSTAILAMVNARKFEERKRTFVVLVSPDLKTTGPENAFVHGANLTVNIRDLKDLEKLILQGQLEFQKLSS